MKKLNFIILIIVISTSLKAQDMVKDVERVTDYLMSSNALTLQIDIKVSNSGASDLMYQAEVIKWKEAYVTSFQGRIMLNNSDYHLQIDDNNNRVSIRNSTQNSEYFQQNLLMTQETADSLMQAKPELLPKREVRKNGDVAYIYADKSSGKLTELILNDNQIRSLRYTVTQENITSTTYMTYTYKKGVSAGHQKMASIATYLKLDKKKSPELTQKYFGYQLVNNLTL